MWGLYAMKRRTLLMILGSILGALMIFSAGVYLGMHLERLDALCPFKPAPAMLTQDISGENGIFIPAGTIVPLYSCEYAERFSIRYYISHGGHDAEQTLFTPYIPGSEDKRRTLQRGILYQYEMMPMPSHNTREK
jgi:hypothetical protein